MDPFSIGRPRGFGAAENPSSSSAMGIEAERIKLEEHLANEYPDTFHFFKRNDRFVFMITKTSLRCPTIDFKAEKAYYAAPSRIKRNIAEAKRGNAYYPKKVLFMQ